MIFRFSPDRLEVLLQKRLKEPGIGCWSIPAGKLENGEELASALQRELVEELGVEFAHSLSHFHGPHVRNSIFPDGRHSVLLCFWSVSRTTVEPENLEPQDHSELNWFPVGMLPQPMQWGDTENIQKALDEVTGVPR